MLIAAILFTVITLLLVAVVVMGNGMSDAPTTPFQGASLFVVPGIVATILWILYFGDFHFAPIITRGTPT